MHPNKNLRPMPPYTQKPSPPVIDELPPPSLSADVVPRGLAVLKTSPGLSGLIGLMTFVFAGIIASIFGVAIGVGAWVASTAGVVLYLTVLSK